MGQHDNVDPEAVVDPEEFAEDAGIDPTPQEVDQYLELAEEVPPWSNPDESAH
ncbi:hypothetical protein FHS29_005199 [Saccharothrix tamanrassetensis]|uniref:Uncharacterized protein n=1 Tax=Saccharothrix tamanrassetensis TaxID=1051531 RepID=A0A841CLZ3_9PSEU|nr:hypothetical protein [Saccharothrix tamanrassetensis]MBB5958591.1 hypothetical protein [Saccharothrix tamanrassetensis]